MSNTDDILIATLRQTGAELDGAIVSIREFGTEAIVAACACCLNVIHEARGEEQRFPLKLPKNPGVRFRLCTNLAKAIAALGYAEEVGFNHFLYPNEAESRGLLLFLVDTLPKSDAADAAAAVGPSGGILEQIRQSLQLHRAQPWVPPAWQPRRHLAADAAQRLRGAHRRNALAAALKFEQEEERFRVGVPAKDGAQSGGFGTAPPPTEAAVMAGVAPSLGGLFSHLAVFTDVASSEESRVSTKPAAEEASEGAPVETAAERAERIERERLEATKVQLDAVLEERARQAAEHEAAVAQLAATKAARPELDAELRRMVEEVRCNRIVITPLPPVASLSLGGPHPAHPTPLTRSLPLPQAHPSRNQSHAIPIAAHCRPTGSRPSTRSVRRPWSCSAIPTHSRRRSHSPIAKRPSLRS